LKCFPSFAIQEWHVNIKYAHKAIRFILDARRPAFGSPQHAACYTDSSEFSPSFQTVHQQEFWDPSYAGNQSSKMMPIRERHTIAIEEYHGMWCDKFLKSPSTSEPPAVFDTIGEYPIFYPGRNCQKYGSWPSQVAAGISCITGASL
jgi:hypothetical protein